jgi:polyisoprenoid-binding protein YceI
MAQMSIAEAGERTGVQVWKLDPAHSLVEFSTKHMMITTVKGRFADVSGTIRLDADDLATSRVEVEIDASSIDTRSEQRDEHLRSAAFLDVERYPSLTFRSTRLEGRPAEAGDRFRVIGDLTIRGETREVELDVVFAGRGMDPWGGERVSFSAETRIDRREFGLTWNQALETGGVLVANEIRIQLEVQAVQSA